MSEIILSISDRGQITIPQKLRAKMKVTHFICTVEDGMVMLKPLQTRDEFLSELDQAEKDWDKNGGKTVAEIKKKHAL